MHYWCVLKWLLFVWLAYLSHSGKLSSYKPGVEWRQRKWESPRWSAIWRHSGSYRKNLNMKCVNHAFQTEGKSWILAHRSENVLCSKIRTDAIVIQRWYTYPKRFGVYVVICGVKAESVDGLSATQTDSQNTYNCSSVPLDDLERRSTRKAP